jgi:hypothetical protein
VGDLAPVLGDLGVVTGFLTVLAGAVFEDGALREDFVLVADFPVTVFAFDPGLDAGFAGVFVVVVVVLEVFKAGLFWHDKIRVEDSRPPRLTSFASSATLGVFGASFTRPDGPRYTKPRELQSHEIEICNLWEARRCLSRHQQQSPYSAE